MPARRRDSPAAPTGLGRRTAHSAELIKYKGYQVPPAGLKALLLTHPAIPESAAGKILRKDLRTPTG